MQNIKKLGCVMLALFAAVTLAAYISYLCGYRGFLINTNIALNIYGTIALNYLLYSIHVSLVILAALGIYNKKSIKIIYIYLLLYIPFNIALQGYDWAYFILSTLIPVVYILAWAVRLKDLPLTLIRLAVITVAMAAYQGLSMIVKNGSFVLGYTDMSACDLAVYSIDLIIFTALLYCIGGVLHAEKIERKAREGSPGRWAKLLSFHSEKIGSVAASPEDDGDLSDLTTRQILLGLFIIALIQLSQWAIILLACQAGSVFWEGLIVSGSAIATGMIIKKRWHRDSVFICTVASTIIFYAAARAIPSFTVSLFIPVLTGLAIMIGLYLVALRLDPPEFALAKHCDPVQLRQIATAKGLTPYEIDLLDAKFCKAMTQTQLEIRFSGWSLSSIKRMIKAAKEKFYQ